VKYLVGFVPFCCEFGAGLDVDGYKYIFKVFSDGAWRDAKFESVAVFWLGCLWFVLFLRFVLRFVRK